MFTCVSAPSSKSQENRHSTCSIHNCSLSATYIRTWLRAETGIYGMNEFGFSGVLVWFSPEADPEMRI